MGRVAITGGIAEGKSTVLGYLRSLGYRTASADEVAKGVFDDPEVQNRLADAIGAKAPIDTATLRQAIAANSKIRRTINQITHAEIARRLLEIEADYYEVPLLIEACLQGEFDSVWVATCGPEEQLRRLSNRIGAREAVQLLGAQLPTSAKLPFADVVIRTNSTERSVFANVRRYAF